jgi:hypothetical protein
MNEEQPAMALFSRLKRLFASAKSDGSGDHDPVQERLSSIEETLRRIRSYERRQGQVLDSLQRDLSGKLDAALADREPSLQCSALYDFAARFAMYYERLGAGRDSTLDHIWKSFETLLRELGLELIFDRNEPFDDTRHRTCDLRHRPDLPPGTVVEVIRPGIMVNGRLQRPADVVVSKAPDASHQNET